MSRTNSKAASRLVSGQGFVFSADDLRVEVIYSPYRQRLVIEIDGETLLTIKDVDSVTYQEMRDTVNKFKAARPLITVQCSSLHGATGLECELRRGHSGSHQNGRYVWNSRGDKIKLVAKSKTKRPNRLLKATLTKPRKVKVKEGPGPRLKKYMAGSKTHRCNRRVSGAGSQCELPLGHAGRHYSVHAGYFT